LNEHAKRICTIVLPENVINAISYKPCQGKDCIHAIRSFISQGYSILRFSSYRKIAYTQQPTTSLSSGPWTQHRYTRLLQEVFSATSTTRGDGALMIWNRREDLELGLEVLA